MSKTSSRVIYAKDEDIELSFEVLNDCLFVHVVINKFSTAVLKRLKAVWEHMKMDAYMDGWEDIYTYTKDTRIVKLIGEAEEIDDPSLTNVGVRMYKWELK